MMNKLLELDGRTDENIVTEEDTYHQLGIRPIPFQTQLSFEPLIRRFEDEQQQRGATQSLLAREIMLRLEKAPELRGPIDDPSLLEQHQEFVELLMGCVLPPALRNTQLAKVGAPFDLNPFYCTPGLQLLKKNHRVEYIINGPPDLIYCAIVVSACSLILNKFYGQDLQIDWPLSITMEESGTGFHRYFKTNFDLQFIDIRPVKPLRPLTQEEINHLLSNIYDTNLWLNAIPPDAFEFSGFALGNLIDITAEETLSRLKFRLLRKDAIVNADNLRELESLLRTYFNLPDLRLGITAIDYPVEQDIRHKYNLRFDFLAQRQEHLLAPANRNSIYEKACKYREVVLVEDLESMRQVTPIEQDLLREGIRSIIVAPLFNKAEKVIGLIELGSPRPFALHTFIEIKFKEITSLFSLAVERSREEIDNRIEAILREQFTAVHPSIEWKFIEASYKLLVERSNNSRQAVMEPIVFPDVYPLYGQADIVSSSEKRNHAIQADLLDNLKSVKKVIERALEQIRFPLLHQLLLNVERGMASLKNDFNSTDESRIIALLQEEVHPLMENLRNAHPDLAGIISGYFDQIDPELRIVYRKRKAYEESVTMINNTISNYLEQQERETQQVMPHYFEKYKTDGVEYDIYVGQSLLKQGTFCAMHLRNLRLWQLLHMCEITRIVDRLQPGMPVPLSTAQLVFAYPNPLTIRFRMDEKQFDVDGAYNVRYEILKKRIDKATIEGTDDRLTAAGKIAIIYLQDRDRQEYLDYIDYLQHEGWITGEVEDLQLARLQGVQGLRALRIAVNLDGGGLR